MNLRFPYFSLADEIFRWSLASASERNDVTDYGAEVDGARTEFRADNLGNSNHPLLALRADHLDTRSGALNPKGRVELVARNAIHRANLAIPLTEHHTDALSCKGEELASEFTDTLIVGGEGDGDD